MNNETIVFGMWPELGAYNTSLRLAKQLSRRGFEVVYLGPERFQKYIEGQGLSYGVIPESQEPTPAANGRARWLAGVREEMHAYAASMEWLERWIAVNKPALLLLDQSAWFFSPPFLKYHVPIVALGLNYASTPSSKYPPVFCGVVPAAGGRRLSRVKNTLAWLACAAAFWRRQSQFYLMTKLASLLGAGSHVYAKSLVTRYGGRVRRSEYGYQLVAPELVLAPREFDFSRGKEWHRDHFYGGLGVDPDRIDGAGSTEENEFPWERLDGRKMVFCSLGTFSAHYPDGNRFYQVVVEAFRRRRDLQLVLAVGKSGANDMLRDLPENVVLVKRAPFIDMVKRASLLITQGGCSSVREALLFGVPMIVFPCWCDQPGNAARVVYHGVGMTADIRKIQPDGLCHMLENVLSNPSLALRVIRLSNLCQRQVDCEAGVEFILKYINNRTPEPACQLA